MSYPSSGLDSFGQRARISGERLTGRGSLEPDREALQRREEGKIRQILQRFFAKGALTVVSSRCDLPPAFVKDGHQVRQDKWFNLDIPDSDALADDVADWFNADIKTDKKPPPMVVEIYLDGAELGRNQTLIAVDDRGRGWDVKQVLQAPGDDNTRGKSTARVEVVLERWKFSLGDPTSAEHADPLPVVYKKALVMFRCLLTFSMLRPAYRFFRNAGKQNSMLNALRPSYRIYSDSSLRPRGKDPLVTPLWPRADSAAKSYRFDPVLTSLGSMCAEVAWRRDCDFKIDDAEAALSSQFRGMDEHFFRPSLETSSGHDVSYLARAKEPGSLPVDRSAYKTAQEIAQAPASLSTFHKAGVPRGASPLSALRAARDVNADSPPSSSSALKKLPAQRPGTASRPSSAAGEVAPSFPRRTSISFQPFKAGSLSSSPASTPPLPSSRSSATRPSGLTSGLTQQARSGGGLGNLPPSSLRHAGAAEEPISSPLATPSPPRAATAVPATRYASSFGHRKRWGSSGSGTHRLDDDAAAGNSSRGGSQSSSTNQGQPGSSVLNEAGGDPSSPSPAATPNEENDDDNISTFLQLVEQNKDLKSFNRTDDASRGASARKTTAALSKFHKLRDSHTQLTESLSSSLTTLQRSSSASSRQMSSVPPALVGNSVSTSSSPGKPVSPHTPHTPAIPSRLSANAPISASEDRHASLRPGSAGSFSRHGIGMAGRHRHHNSIEEESTLDDDPEAEGEAEADGSGSAAMSPVAGPDASSRTRTPGAIDIPTSPAHMRSPGVYSSRRSSSVRTRPRLSTIGRPRTASNDDEHLGRHGVGLGSASLPPQPPQPLGIGDLSLSELLAPDDSTTVRRSGRGGGVGAADGGGSIADSRRRLEGSDDRRSSPSQSASASASASVSASASNDAGSLFAAPPSSQQQQHQTAGQGGVQHVRGGSTGSAAGSYGGGAGSVSGSGGGMGIRQRMGSRPTRMSVGSFERSRWSFSRRNERESVASADSGGGGSGGVAGGAGGAGAGGSGLADDEEPLLFMMETQNNPGTAGAGGRGSRGR